MTIDEMFNEIENQEIDTYIVTLKYKYDFEKKYTIENQILVYDSVADSYAWQNDWNEGQTDVEVLGYMLLGDVDTTKLEPCEDCISRQAVDELSKALVHTTRDKADFLCNFWERLQKLPPVTPHKRGKWLDKKTTIKGGHGLAYGRYGCSVCKKKQPSKTDFCPNCGADMKGEGE